MVKIQIIPFAQSAEYNSTVDVLLFSVKMFVVSSIAADLISLLGSGSQYMS